MECGPARPPERAGGRVWGRGGGGRGGWEEGVECEPARPPERAGGGLWEGAVECGPARPPERAGGGVWEEAYMRSLATGKVAEKGWPIARTRGRGPNRTGRCNWP